MNTIKTYAIVGGCGFLGQHLIHLLLNNKNYPIHIKVFDKISNLDAVAKIFPDDFKNENIEFILDFDISKKNEIDKFFLGVDTLFHLAAAIAYGRKNKKLLKAVNVEGVKHIIFQAKSAGVKKIIYVSSFATLGCLDNQDKAYLASESHENDWVREKHCYYGLSKYFGEQIALAAHLQPETGVTIAIPGLLIGPGPGCAANMAPFRYALRKWVVVPEGGSSFIDVRDMAQGLIALANTDSAKGKYLFVSHNLEYADFLNKIAALVSHPLKQLKIPRLLSPMIANCFALFEWLQPKSFACSKEGITKAFKYRYYSNQKATHELSWKPRYTLTETLQDTINWLKNEKV